MLTIQANQKKFIPNEEWESQIKKLDELQARQLLKQVIENNQEYYNALLQKYKNLCKFHLEEYNPIESTQNLVGSTKSRQKKMLDVELYLSLLKECKTKEEMVQVLPKHHQPDFELLMNTILSEIVLYCNDIDAFLANEKLSKEEKDEFKQEIKDIQEIMNWMVQYRDQINTELEEESKNNLVYLTSSSGNVYALNDIKSIDQAYYDSFLELINSIINGTFKNIKTFVHNNKLVQLYEVKNFKTRIVFSKIFVNTFLIISIFIKKTDNDLKYREQLINRSIIFQNNKTNLKQLCQEENFLKSQEEITGQILRILKKEDTYHE